jgi:hypothetical protein
MTMIGKRIEFLGMVKNQKYRPPRERVLGYTVSIWGSAWSAAVLQLSGNHRRMKPPR